MYYSTFLALCVALSHFAFSQSAYPLLGGRANGTGYTSSCQQDGAAIFNNPAGLTGISQMETGVTFHMVPDFPPFSRYGAYMALPVKIGTAAASIFRFGDDVYNEQIIALSYANRFGITSLGIKVNYVQYYAEGFGSKGIFTVSFGGITQLTPWLRAGAHVVNLTQPEIADDEKVPTLLLAGIQMKASENVAAMIEVEKDLDFKPKLKAGLEYIFKERFHFRTGVNVQPAAGFFGLGFHNKRFKFDYALSYTPSVGNSHQTGLSWTLKTKK